MFYISQGCSFFIIIHFSLYCLQSELDKDNHPFSTANSGHWGSLSRFTQTFLLQSPCLALLVGQFGIPKPAKKHAMLFPFQRTCLKHLALARSRKLPRCPNHLNCSIRCGGIVALARPTLSQRKLISNFCIHKLILLVTTHSLWSQIRAETFILSSHIIYNRVSNCSPRELLSCSF